PRERLELLDGQDVAAHRAALEVEHLVLAVELRQRLRGEGRVAPVRTDEGEGSRPLEQLLERVRAGLVGAARAQAVLPDADGPAEGLGRRSLCGQGTAATSSTMSRVRSGSTRTPGPIVVVSVTVRR